MGLEMGSPWLVAVVLSEDNHVVIFQDNFTGAGFERVRKVIRDEPGSFSAVMGKNRQLARQRDGTLFQPMLAMKGKNSGTPANRGHSSYMIACELLQEAPYPLASVESTKTWIADTVKWNSVALVAVVLLFLLVG